MQACSFLPFNLACACAVYYEHQRHIVTVRAVSSENIFTASGSKTTGDSKEFNFTESEVPLLYMVLCLEYLARVNSRQWQMVRKEKNLVVLYIS